MLKALTDREIEDVKIALFGWKESEGSPPDEGEFQWVNSDDVKECEIEAGEDWPDFRLPIDFKESDLFGINITVKGDVNPTAVAKISDNLFRIYFYTICCIATADCDNVKRAMEIAKEYRFIQVQ